MSSVFDGLTEKQEQRLRDHAHDVLKNDAVYNPYVSCNFWEAIGECDDLTLNRTCGKLQAGLHAEAAAEMNRIAYDYWFEHVCCIRREMIIEQLAREDFDKREGK